MKRTTALYAVTAIAVISFAGQAFAKAGSMGGGQGHGSTSGTHQMGSTMHPASGNGMHQSTMLNNAYQHGPTAGSAQQDITQGGSGNSGSHLNGQMHGNGTAPTTRQQSVTTATN